MGRLTHVAILYNNVTYHVLGVFVSLALVLYSHAMSPIIIANLVRVINREPSKSAQ